MITYDYFEKCINSILFLNGVEINKKRSQVLYGLIKNDFNDDSFGIVCKDICISEELYGKYPTPNMFYSRKKESEKTVFIEEGSFYIDNTMPEYKPVLANLANEQADIVCENLWKWLIKNKRGEFVSQQFIVERLKQFMPVQSEETQIEYGKVKNLLIGSIKKIGG